MSKCQVLHIGHSIIDNRYDCDGVLLDTVDLARDLGVIISPDLHFKQHISQLVAKSFRISALILRHFASRDRSFLLGMYKTYVRPMLEYATPVWSPYFISYIDKVESVQRYFTKRIPGMRNLPYSDRLVLVGLESIELRRLKFDLIMVYKTLNGFSGLEKDIFFKYSLSKRTRSYTDNPFKLAGSTSHLIVSSHFFAERVVTVWNSLPHDIVTCVSLSKFKHKLNSLTVAGTLSKFMKGSAKCL